MKSGSKYFLIVFLSFYLKTISQQQKTDSLLHLLKKDKEDTVKVNHLNKLAQLQINDPDTAIYFSKEALSLSQKINWQTGIGQSYHQLASYYHNNDNYSMSLDLNFKALEVWNALEKTSSGEMKNKTDLFRSKTLGNIGTVYQSEGNYPRALDYYLKALKIDEALSNKKGMAVKLGNIGIIYKRQNNVDKALTYYLKALTIAEELDDKRIIAIQLNSIGNVYQEMAYMNKAKKHTCDSLREKALGYFLKALALNQELENKGQEAINLGNIAGVYHNRNNYAEAQKYYFKALKIAENLNDKDNQARLLGNIGALYTHQKKYNEAEKYLLQSFELSEMIGSMKLKMENSDFIFQLYNEKKEYKKALEYYKLCCNFNDSLYNKEKSNELTRHEMNYEFDKKVAAAKAEQEKKDAVTATERKKQKTVLALVCCVLILVFIFAVFVFRSLRITRKQKLFIEIKNKETEEQKQIIVEKNKDILDSIHYAKRIQQSLLPSEMYIDKSLKKLYGK